MNMYAKYDLTPNVKRKVSGAGYISMKYKNNFPNE